MDFFVRIGSPKSESRDGSSLMNRAAARPSTARFCILSVRERVVQSRGCLSIRQTDAWLQPELKGFEVGSPTGACS